MILNRTLFLFVAVLLVVVQSTLANLFAIRGAKIELLPALVVYCAVATNLPTALLVAFGGGLLQDVLSAGPLGLSVLPLASIAIVLDQTRRYLVRDFFLVQSLLGAAAALAVSVWMFLCQLVMAGHSTASASTLQLVFWVVLSSAVLTPLLFRALDRLLHCLGHPPGRFEAP